MKTKPQIEYPYLSEKSYRSVHPFIHIIKDNRHYYGYENNQVFLIDPSIRPFRLIVLLPHAASPNTHQLSIFKQALHQLKGIEYKLLYVYQNQYLCIGKIKNQFEAFVILQIDLNTKGYYEITGMQDILKHII